MLHVLMRLSVDAGGLGLRLPPKVQLIAGERPRRPAGSEKGERGATPRQPLGVTVLGLG